MNNPIELCFDTNRAEGFASLKRVFVIKNV